MKYTKIILSAFIIFSLTSFSAAQQSEQLSAFLLTQNQINQQNRKTYEFINGQWFDGKKFKRKTYYSANGIFTLKKPSKIDETIDLKSGFVVPPFADAHCHHFDAAYNFAHQVGMYLKDGIFYAKVLADSRSGAMEIKDKINRPESVDVAYAHGALTPTNGHIFEVYETLALGLIPFAKVFEENRAKIAASRIRENDAYYIIDTTEDLEKKWQMILNGKPDFIKIALVGSENYAEKRENIQKIPLGSIGLDPKLVPLIVQKAHDAGLRVSAHVETMTDYRIALKSDVDEMAHLPGYYVADDEEDELKTLTEDDAKETARRKVWVVAAPIALEFEPTQQVRRDRILKHNLELLKKYKIHIAFGSDQYDKTNLNDVLYLAKLGVFTNQEILKIWCEKTPQTIFLNRKIGLLKDGYEASFIVLGGNPIQDFEKVKNIQFRFKQGQIINFDKKK